MFGNPETTPGGRALKFYASVRLNIRRIGQIKEGNDIIGSRTRVKVVKNKVAAPFKQAEFDILYNQGISREGCLIDLGLEQKIIAKRGISFSYQDQSLGRGYENTRVYLKANPEIAKKIEEEIRAKYKTTD